MGERAGRRNGRFARRGIAMAKRFWRQGGIPRNEVKDCAWCEQPATFQELNGNGDYVGACKTHKDKLRPMTIDHNERLRNA
jgi:hypothetical protein